MKVISCIHEWILLMVRKRQHSDPILTVIEIFIDLLKHFVHQISR